MLMNMGKSVSCPLAAAGAGGAGDVGAAGEPARRVRAAGHPAPVPLYAGGARGALLGARAPPGRAADQHGRG